MLVGVLGLLLLIALLALIGVIGSGFSDDKLITLFSSPPTGILGLFAKSPLS